MENTEQQVTNSSNVKISETPKNQNSSNKPKIFFVGIIIFSFLIAFIIGGLVLGSNNNPSPVSNKTIGSGIKGKIMLGPTCPAVGPGMEEECKDKPYQATVIVKSQDGQTEIIRVTSDSNGNFKISLSEGVYVVDAVSQKSNSGFPFAKPENATVEKDKFTNVTINFDTGIR